jgi:hypothetical protein
MDMDIVNVWNNWTSYLEVGGLTNNPEHWSVILGEHHLKKSDWFEQSRSVSAIYTHPGYKSSEVKALDKDTLLLVPPDYDLGEWPAWLYFLKPGEKEKYKSRIQHV